jgi:hypothetical protein
MNMSLSRHATMVLVLLCPVCLHYVMDWPQPESTSPTLLETPPSSCYLLLQCSFQSVHS